MTTAMAKRVATLEGGRGEGVYVPCQEGGVYYAGPRDPSAILQALGLVGRKVTLEISSVGVDPAVIPVLVGGTLTISGRFGMNAEFQKFTGEAGRNCSTGGTWSLHSYGNGKGWVMDTSLKGWIRDFNEEGIATYVDLPPPTRSADEIFADLLELSRARQ